MHHTPREWVQAGSQALSLVLLLAGGVLFLQLLSRWRRGTHPLITDASVARLRARPWRPVDAGLLLLAILLPMAPSMLAVLQPADRAATAPPHAFYFTPFLLYYSLVVAAVLLAARRSGAGIATMLGVSREMIGPSVRTGLMLGLATLPPVILAAWLAEWALRGLGMPLVRQPVFDVLADPNLGGIARALLIFVAVAVAPIAEEAVFRGVIFPAVLRSRRLVYTLLLVNALFALLHLHAPAFLPLLAVGVCFSAGMLATGSLLTPIVMHAIFNGEMLLVFYAWPDFAR